MPEVGTCIETIQSVITVTSMTVVVASTSLSCLV